MLTGEMKDRDLIEWIDSQLSQYGQSLATLAADDTHFGRDHNYAVNITRGFFLERIESWRRNIDLGIRCIDGKHPELADRPWSEADEIRDGLRAVAYVVR